MEQRERQVFELLDLGYGPCTMVLASRDGADAGRRGAAPARRRARRDQVPADRRRVPRATGRQAEIVEVKGSVELAPLTGMVEAIVDLTATGTTLRENGLVVREEIATSTARLIANRVSLRVKAAAIDCARGAPAWLSCRRLCARRAPATRRRSRPSCARACPAAPTSSEAVARIVARGPRGRRRGARRARGRARRARGRRGDRASPPDELDAALAALEPRAARGARAGDRERRRRRARRASARTSTSSLPQGQSVRLREIPVDRAAIYVPGGRAPYPSSVVMGAVTAREAGVERDRRLRARRAPADPRRLRAVRRARGLPRGRRTRDRRARLRDRDDPPRRRDRRAREPLGPGGQAPGLGRRRDRRLRRARATCFVLAAAGADAELVALDVLAQAEHGPGTLALRRRATTARCSTRSASRIAASPGGRGADRARRRPRPRERARARRGARARAPQLVGGAAEALAPRVRRAGCLFVGREAGHGVRRLRRRLEPHAADRRRGALRLRARRRATSAGA